MNAVEIEEAISQLADQPFDRAKFAYAFLEAFGNKETTIERLRAGASNKSDLGGVLQINNIHIVIYGSGEVSKTLTALRDSPATAKAKAKFILATAGVDFEAEDLSNGETVAWAYRDFADHFGFFLPLAGGRWPTGDRQLRCGASFAGGGPGQKKIPLRGIGLRWRKRRRDLQPDRHGQAEWC